MSDSTGKIVCFDDAADVGAFKTKLAANALYVEFPMQEPEYEILEDKYQDVLHNIVTFEGYTKISVNTSPKPAITGVFKSELFGKTVENKAEIKMQSNLIVLRVNSDGELVSIALGEDTEEGNVIKIIGDVVTGGNLRSENYIGGTQGSILNLADGSFASKYLSWDKYGNIKASNADIAGKITASSGAIGLWKILASGGLLAEKSTGTPGTLNRVYLQPFLSEEYDSTWVISSQYFDIDSSGNVSDTGNAYWYIKGGGDIFTKGQIQTKGIYPQIIGDDSVLQMSYTNASGTGMVIESGYLRAASDNTTILGKSNKRYNAIYLVNSPNVTSDKNEKNTIDYLEDEEKKEFIRKFFAGLKPASYKLNSGTSGRTHFGLISNDIEELLAKIGATSLDFAGFIKSPKTKDVVVEITDEDGNVVYNEDGAVKTEIKEETVEGEYAYALRYEEFISPLIKMVQMQQEQLDNLTETIQKQQLIIEELKNSINPDISVSDEGGEVE